MKTKLITLAALGALALGSLALANDPADAGKDRPGGRGGRHNSFDKMTEQLNLTADQQAKVQPIIDLVKPQLETIRREALQKSKALMDNAKEQIRPILTPEQQKKLDEMRAGGRDEKGGRHGHRHGQDGDSGPDDQ
ncbi:MAG: hypothetical protein H0T83_09185 [Chthoniobacterales bacterium]|nr:hypothetical protein [Chthoniobacterales bacterium]